MNTAKLDGLATQWREEAGTLRRRGLEREARMIESFAEDLECAVRDWLLEPLTLDEAATESGFSYDHLQHAVGDTIPNAGEKGRPRIARRDLPRKPGRGASQRRRDGAPDLATAALTLQAGDQTTS